MADSSFDIVSEINLQEVDNAINQAQKEIGTRYDFKGSAASVEFDRKAKEPGRSWPTASRATGNRSARSSSRSSSSAASTPSALTRKRWSKPPTKPSARR